MLVGKVPGHVDGPKLRPRIFTAPAHRLGMHGTISTVDSAVSHTRFKEPKMATKKDDNDKKDDKKDGPMEIVFLPGCFDDFEGTQEELDALILEIKQGFESGDFLDESTLIDVDDLPEDLYEKLAGKLSDIDPPKLH